MSEILEATMLVCFGFSWPLNLIKNIRARSAKGMSLQFILLIIAGYVAGITAKLMNHRINYVLAVYFINLAIVSCNVVVYFHNRRLDAIAEKSADAAKETAVAAEENAAEIAHSVYTMEHVCNHHEEIFAEINSCVPEDAIVFFGSTHFAELPVAELAHSFHMDENLCNRSIPDASIDAAAHMLDVCVLDLKPSKVFVNLGDADVVRPDFDEEAFLSEYEEMIDTIHEQTKAEVYVVSLMSETPLAKEVNSRLKAIAEHDGCDFIDISAAASASQPDLRTFSILKCYMHDHSMDFSSAMSAASM